MASRVEQKAEEHAARVREVGLYEAGEGDNNSVAVSDDAYVGVSPEYKNYANDTDKPYVSEDEDVAALEQRQIDHDKEMTESASSPVHPSEAINPTHPTVLAVEAAEDDAVMRERIGASSGSGSSSEDTPGIAGGSTKE